MSTAVAVVALLMVACTSHSKSATSTSSSATSPSTTSAPTGPTNVAATAVEKQALTAAFVAYTHLPASDVAGTEQGSVYEGYLPSTATYWAIAHFVPTSGASEQTKVGLQDGGDIGIFSHKTGAPWVMLTTGTVPFCPSKTVPAAMLTFWGVTDAQGCATSGQPSPQATAVLGRAWQQGLEGFGHVKPTTISYGGDPTGIVQNITWDSWGGAQATGHGTSTYVGPNQSVAEGSQETATLVAFNLGTCQGTYMYQAVEWYFAGHGDKFNPSQYRNICTGENVGTS